MPDSKTDLFTGSPRFADRKLDAMVQEGNLHGAWHAAMNGPSTESALQDVSGDFAIGLYRPDGSAYMAVDRFAIHSLYYCIESGQITFATRADALGNASKDIDPQAIFDYLYFHVIPSPRTIFKGVFRLPPGHYGEFANGQLRVAPYWRPVFEEPRERSFDDLKKQFRHLLKESVATQLHTGKAACFLSGGTDSSTVAGMAGQVQGGRVDTYSIGFDAQGYDEMEFARLAAKHFGADHHEYYVKPDDLVRGIPGMAAHFDQPFGNSSVLPAYYCAKMARDDGVDKLLAGDGGDELFGGNSRYAKQRVFGWYDHVPGFLQRGLMEPILRTRLAASVPLTRKAGSYVEQARVPMPDRLQMYNLIMRLGVNDVLTPGMVAQIDTRLPLQLQREVWAMQSNCSKLNQELAYDWRFTLSESDLPKVRHATGLASVEVGYPMLDDRLLAFSLRLPTEYKLKGLHLRWFFKEALRGFLPDEIIAKKKQGFGLPFGVWANGHDNLKRLATDSLQNLAHRGVVRADFVGNLLKQKLPEHPGYYGEMVWILMMLEQWMQQHAPNFEVPS
jgi:asparagine synthase (glutamine-hydrolysing)